MDKVRLIGMAANRVGTKRAKDGAEVTENFGADVPTLKKPSGLCPRCGRMSNFGVASDTPLDEVEYGHLKSKYVFERAVVFTCRGCGKGLVVVEEQHEAIYDKPDVKAYQYEAAIHCYPLPQAKVSADVPADIGSVYREAVTALTAGLPRSAMAMARAALDGLTKDKGDLSATDLFARLEKMGRDGIIQQSLVDWSHEVRKVGNKAVHDPSVTVEFSDAQQLVEFVGQLLQYLYVMPADLARRRNPTTITSDVTAETRNPDDIARERIEAQIAPNRLPV